MKLNLTSYNLFDNCPACQALRDNPNALDLNGFAVMGEDGFSHTCATVRAICIDVLKKIDLNEILRSGGPVETD
jgi:hypothetical protein